MNYNDGRPSDMELSLKQDIDENTEENDTSKTSSPMTNKTHLKTAKSTTTLLSNNNNIIITSINEINIFSSLSSVLTHIHLLWELVLLAEPIVVMASSPTHCSHMVQTLMR